MQFEILFYQVFPAFWLPKHANIGSLILSQSVGLCKLQYVPNTSIFKIWR